MKDRRFVLKEAEKGYLVALLLGSAENGGDLIEGGGSRRKLNAECRGQNLFREAFLESIEMVSRFDEKFRVNRASTIRDRLIISCFSSSNQSTDGFFIHETGSYSRRREKHYHCISRVKDRRFVLKEAEKGYLVALMLGSAENGGDLIVSGGSRRKLNAECRGQNPFREAFLESIEMVSRFDEKFRVNRE